MDQSHVEQFLVMIGCDRIKPGHNAWVNASCFVAGTPVLTSKGLSPIEEVLEGDLVMTRTQGWQPVIGLHRNLFSGVLRTIRVRGLNYSFEGTSTHKVFAVRKEAVDRAQWRRWRDYYKSSSRNNVRSFPLDIKDIEEVALGDLRNGDRLVIPKSPHQLQTFRVLPADYEVTFETYNQHGWKGKRRKLLKSPVAGRHRLTEDLAFILGAWVAEGSFGRTKRGLPSVVNFTCRLQEPLVAEITTRLERIFGSELYVSVKDKPAVTTTLVTVPDSLLARYFETIMGSGAENKRIPLEVMKASKKIKTAFLEGYCMGDGWKTKAGPRVGASQSVETTSPTLSVQIPILLADLGIACRGVSKPDRVDSKGLHHRKSYTTTWSMKQNRTLGFDIAGHMTYPVEIVSERSVTRFPVYNLAVDKEEAYTVGPVSVRNCPLSTWRHPKGTDNTPSFGISVEPTGSSKYKCWTCGTSGELSYLVWSIARYTKKDRADLLKYVQIHNAPSESELKSRNKASEYWASAAPKPIAGVSVNPVAMDRKMQIPELVTLPESDLDAFRNIPEEVYAYLQGPKRRLTAETIQAWELGYHRGASRISIPIRDCTNALVGISGRAFYDDQKPKYLHSSGFRSAFYLYGEHRIRRGRRGILVEGFFDVQYLHQWGYNAVAMQGTSLSPIQVQKLKEFFSELLILPDGDRAGYEAAEKLQRVVSAAMPVRIASDMPEGLDPDNLDEDLLLQLLGVPDFTD